MYINNFIGTAMSLSQNILCNSDLKQVLCDKIGEEALCRFGEVNAN